MRILISPIAALLLVSCERMGSGLSKNEPPPDTSVSPKSETSNFEATGAYQELRTKVLELKPEVMGQDADDDHQVIAVLMETGYREYVATLIVGDGVASVYFSNGSGDIDASNLASVRPHSQSVLRLAGQCLPAMSLTDEHSLPRETGDVGFYLVTGRGVYGASGKEDDVKSQDHPLSPLFNSAHELLAAIGEPSDM